MIENENLFNILNKLDDAVIITDRDKKIVFQNDYSIEIFEKHFLPPTRRSGGLQVKPITATEVAAFRLFPGMSIDILHHLLQRPLKGIILETFGDGNGPTENREFLEAISAATQEGMVILGCTQCLHGEMTQGSYATGTALTEAGVIPGRDMTIEAALTKMQFLFSQNLSVNEIRDMIGHNIVGEISTITA